MFIIFAGTVHEMQNVRTPCQRQTSYVRILGVKCDIYCKIQCQMLTQPQGGAINSHQSPNPRDHYLHHII